MGHDTPKLIGLKATLFIRQTKAQLHHRIFIQFYSRFYKQTAQRYIANNAIALLFAFLEKGNIDSRCDPVAM
jgi:hypothetical protein